MKVVLRMCIGDHAQRNIALFVGLVLNASDAADVLHDVLNSVYLEVVHTLHYTGQTLQTHTGIDVGMLGGSVVAAAIRIKLGEYQFQISI